MKFAIALFALCLAGCDIDKMDTAPADYERAQADCSTHGGLRSVTTVSVMFRDDRVDAVCADAARISRKPLPATKDTP